MPEFDIGIAGGGPAGLASALALGRSGWRVRVFDRRALPADKTCGEGIMPPGVAVLKDLGVADRIDPGGRHPFDGIRYLSPSGARAESAFAEGPGWGVRRTCLSSALLEAARELPSVEICDGNSVDRFRVSDDRVEIECGSAMTTCRLLIGADGLHSRVREQAGLAGEKSKRRRLGTRRHFRIKPWSRFVEVHAGDGLEAYATPCGPERVGVAVLWETSEAVTEASGSRERFDVLLDSLPGLRERLADASPDGETMSTGPLEQRTRDCIADGVALIGDAAGYLDACTGEGITLALKEALALDNCLAMVPRQGALIRRAELSGYRRRVREITQPYQIGTRLMIRVAGRPRLMEKTIRALGKRPEMLRHFLSFNMGEGRAWPGMGKAFRFGLDLVRS